MDVQFVGNIIIWIHYSYMIDLGFLKNHVKGFHGVNFDPNIAPGVILDKVYQCSGHEGTQRFKRPPCW